MRSYGHNRQKVLDASEGKPAKLAYPSGNNHVLLPNGQQVNPGKIHESKKDRLRRRAAAKRNTPVNFPLINVPGGIVRPEAKP